MKLNFSYLLAFGVALTLITFAGATPVMAQEEGIPGYELQDPVHPGLNSEEKTLLADPESKPFKNVRDSVATTPARSYYSAPKKAAEVKASGKPANEEDPLSFNFLYYIIQKFKASDIIDQD